MHVVNARVREKKKKKRKEEEKTREERNGSEEQLSYIRSIRGSVANFSVGRSRERDGRETGTG